MNKMKKLISLLLSIVMVIGLLPVTALADDVPYVKSSEYNAGNPYVLDANQSYQVDIENPGDTVYFTIPSATDVPYYFTASDLSENQNTVYVDLAVDSKGEVFATHTNPNGEEIWVGAGTPLTFIVYYEDSNVTGEIHFHVNQSTDSGETEIPDGVELVYAADTTEQSYQVARNGTEYWIRLEENEQPFAYFCVMGDGNEHMITAFDRESRDNGTVLVSYALLDHTNGYVQTGEWYDPSGASIVIPENHTLEMAIMYTAGGFTGDIVFQTLSNDVVSPDDPEIDEYTRLDPIEFDPVSGIITALPELDEGRFYITTTHDGGESAWGVFEAPIDGDYEFIAAAWSVPNDVDIEVFHADNMDVSVSSEPGTESFMTMPLKQGDVVIVHIKFTDAAVVGDFIYAIMMTGTEVQENLIESTTTSADDRYTIILGRDYIARIVNPSEKAYLHFAAPGSSDYVFVAIDTSENGNDVFLNYNWSNGDSSVGDCIVNPDGAFVYIESGSEVEIEVYFEDQSAVGDIMFFAASIDETRDELTFGSMADAPGEADVDKLLTIKQYMHNIGYVQGPSEAVYVRFVAPAAGDYLLSAYDANGVNNVSIANYDPSYGTYTGAGSSPWPTLSQYFQKGEIIVIKVWFEDADTVGSISFSVAPLNDDCIDENCESGSFQGYGDGVNTVNGELHLCVRNFLPAFLAWLQQSGIDADGNGALSADEANAVTEINCRNWDIMDLSGIKYFPNLALLDCTNCPLGGLDVTMLTKLEALYCGYDYPHNRTPYLHLDSVNNASLIVLDCHNMNLSQPINLTGLTKLEGLDINNNHYSTDGFSVIGLNASNLPNLMTLNYGNTQLNMDYTQFTKLNALAAYSNNLEEMDVSMLSELWYLNIDGNRLKWLDLSANADLESVLTGYQFVDIIDGSVMEGGVEGYNYTVDLSAYVGENIANIAGVCDQDGEPVQVMSGDGSKAYFENEPQGFMYSYVVHTPQTDVTLQVCVGDIDPYSFGGGPGDEPGDDTSQIVIPADEMAKEFPDEAFRRCVLNHADRNGDGALSENEIAGCYGIDAAWGNASDLTGLQWFPHLQHLSVNGNGLETLDVSFLPELKELHCYDNQLTELDLSNNSKLTYLEADANKLRELNVSNLTELETLWISSNPITQIDLSANTKLRHLYASDCYLTDLDLTNNPELITADIEQQNLHVDAIAQEYDSENGVAAVNLSQFSFIDLSRINYVFNSASFDASTGIAAFNMREVVNLRYSYQAPNAQGGYYEMVIRLTAECIHDWIPATCTTLQTCSICGTTVGGYAHDWIPGNCTTPKTCSICGATEGGVVHNWTEATCSTPKTCTLCEITEGSAVACKAGSWVTTEYDNGTYLVRSCVWCGEILEIKEADLLPGVLTDMTDEAKNAFEAELSEADSDLIDLVLTEEEKTAVETGALAHVTLSVEDITDTVDPDYAQYLEDWLGDEHTAAFLDINMHKQIGTAEPEQITSSSNGAQFAITLQLPEELRSAASNMSRHFYALYVSDDGVNHIDSEYDFYTHTITIYTDHFSVYAIAYSEYESEHEPIHLDTVGSYTVNLTEANDYEQSYYYIAPADGKVTLEVSVEYRDGMSFGYGFNNQMSDIRSLHEDDVAILSVAAGDVVDISFGEWSRNDDTEVNFTIDFTDEESEYPMDGRVVLSKLRKNDYTGLLYHWTAEETGTIALEMLSHVDAQPVLQVIKTSGYYENTYTSFDTLEVPVVAGDQITVQILTEAIECSETFDDGWVDTWIEHPESTAIWKGEFVEELSPVAVIGDVEYATISEALANAKSGDIVTLVADAHEESTNLVVDEGVTLNVGQFDLYCRSLNVFTGGMITGGEYSQNGDWGKIYVPAASRMVMSGTVVENDGSIGLIPVWDDAASCYVFGGAFFNASRYVVAVDETAKTLSFKFIPSLRTKLMQGYFQDANEMRDNGLRLVLRLTWPGADEDGNINGQAQQDFVYSSEFVKTYMAALGNARFTFLLTGYDTLVTEEALAQMTITPMFISDNGMVFAGQTVELADYVAE